MLRTQVNLPQIREQMQQADVSLHVHAESHDISLFFVNGEGQTTVALHCREVFSYQITRDPRHDEPPYFVGEAHLTQARTAELAAAEN